MNIIELIDVVKDGDQIEMKYNGTTKLVTCKVDGLGDLQLLNEKKYHINRIMKIPVFVGADYEIVGPKYFLKHKWIETDKTLNRFMNDSYGFDLTTESEVYQTKFTRYEIEKIKWHNDTELEDFKMVEVEEND